MKSFFYNYKKFTVTRIFIECGYHTSNIHPSLSEFDEIIFFHRMWVRQTYIPLFPNSMKSFFYNYKKFTVTLKCRTTLNHFGKNYKKTYKSLLLVLTTSNTEYTGKIYINSFTSTITNVLSFPIK